MQRTLKLALAIAGLTLAAAVTAQAGRPGAKTSAAPARKAADSRLVARGDYLVRIAGCHDCHTPFKLDEGLGVPVPDMSRALSGHPEGGPDPASTYAAPDMGIMGPTMTSFALPFGVVYASNITSDPTTGIGSWKEDAFVRAMRTGRHAGAGRPILPPMPWQNLAAMTDEDLRAVYLYLLSTTPIRNAVPKPKVPPEAMKQLSAAYEKMGAQHGAHPAAPGAPATRAAPAAPPAGGPR
jgi:hypothetical protein